MSERGKRAAGQAVTTQVAKMKAAKTDAAKTQAEWFGEQAYAAWQAGQAAQEAGDLSGARRWLERARRIAPDDAMAALSLAVLLLRLRDPAAASLFAEVTRKDDLREAWLGLAAAHAETGAWSQAATALGQALSRHVLPVATDIAPLASRIAHAVGAAGWCGLRADGWLDIQTLDPGRGALRAELDGMPLRLRLKAIPRRGTLLALSQAGLALMGSPLQLARSRQVEGVVGVTAAGIAGWAWHRFHPECDPVLTIRAVGGAAFDVVATDAEVHVTRPLARPRRFSIPAHALAPGGGTVHVTGSDGRALPGSPVIVAGAGAAAAAVSRAVASVLSATGRARRAASERLEPLDLSSPAELRGPPAAAPSDPARSLAVVVPVYRDQHLTLACLDAVRATMPSGTRIIAVDDATPEPELAASLDARASRGEIILLRHVVNRGFPAAANAGMRAAAELPERPDIVLLNADALVTPGALSALRAVVHGAPDIGTATPFSNDATILSYPARDGGNPAPDPAARARLARLAARANAGVAVEVPTAVGFCMYVRRECLAAVGLFREDVFAQGYGEENDFCIRARHLGWRHVAAPGAFVAHVGGQSFGDVRHALIARNLAVLERLHPGYHALIAVFQDADPLADARRRLDMARWAAGRSRGASAAAILVTHDSGGGVERVVSRRCEELRRAGQRPIVLRSVRDPDARSADDRLYLTGWCEVSEGVDRGYPNLRFSLPAQLDDLVRLLRADRPEFLELHHLLGHDHAVLGIARRLGIPWDVHIHDYAWFCPRITLLGAGRRYCGEPTNPATCEDCVADLGRHDEQDITVAALRARSAGDLVGARRVVVPSGDAGARIRRHFPAVRPEIRGLENDAPLPQAVPRSPPATRQSGMRRVCVIGGIGPEKGYDVLLACARDAATRDLNLEFVVVGHTVDDARLFATRRVFVTGRYRDDAVIEEINAQAADLAFLPSVWPETWCYTLGHAWRAGLYVAAFDIGAPAERIRSTGRGWVYPLGLPPAAINNALLAASAHAGDECSVVRPA